MANMYESKVEEDPKTGELILPLPEALLDEMGWDEDTFLVWDKIEEDKVTIREATPEEIEEGSND